jgi:hypothetical protein
MLRSQAVTIEQQGAQLELMHQESRTTESRFTTVEKSILEESMKINEAHAKIHEMYVYMHAETRAEAQERIQELLPIAKSSENIAVTRKLGLRQLTVLVDSARKEQLAMIAVINTQIIIILNKLMPVS